MVEVNRRLTKLRFPSIFDLQLVNGRLVDARLTTPSLIGCQCDLNIGSCAELYWQWCHRPRPQPSLMTLHGLRYCEFVIIQRMICWRVWGSPANFNGFHVLAALLHGTLIVGVGETLQHWTEASPIFDRAAITLFIGPHSSWFIKWPCVFDEGRRRVLSDSVGSWSAGAGYGRHRPRAADASWSTHHFDVQPQQEGIR